MPKQLENGSDQFEWIDQSDIGDPTRLEVPIVFAKKRRDVSAISNVHQVAYLRMITRRHHPKRPITMNRGKHRFRLVGRGRSVLHAADNQHRTKIPRQCRDRRQPIGPNTEAQGRLKTQQRFEHVTNECRRSARNPVPDGVPDIGIHRLQDQARRREWAHRHRAGSQHPRARCR